MDDRLVVRMSARKWIIGCAVLGVSAAAFGSNLDGITLTHHEPLERVTLQGKDARLTKDTQGIGPVELRFDALGRSFDLQLEPNAGLLAAMSHKQPAGDIVPYRGRLAGIAESWARIVIHNGMPAGLVWDGESLYAIEIPGDSFVDAATPVTYRLSDMIVAPGALSCAGGASMTDGAAMYKLIVSNLSAALAQAPGAVSEIDIGAVGDSAFTNDQGSQVDAENAIITRLNNVDGIFSSQVGVQINVTAEAFTDANDPFSDTTDSSSLLTELRLYRESESSQNSKGLTHLYTGRNLDGSTVGIAYMDALCSRGFGAGLSQGGFGPALDSLIAAHELGHNFGAPHDGVAGPCESVTSTFLMATSLSDSDQFSDCSISEMQDNIAAASCITLLPSTDISIVSNDPPSPVLLMNEAAVTFDVVNVGTEVARNVAVNITLPNNVSFLAASGGSASCTNGAGGVNCQFGDVAGSSATSVTVSAESIAVGVGDLAATVTADTDDNAGNNQAVAQLTVDPAVNLVVTAPSAEVTVDQSKSVSVTLANRSVLDASTVTLQISFDSGLRATTASWSIGTCTVATEQQIDCTANQFGGQTNSTLNFGVTGLTTGAKNYTVTLASTEVDADPANNSAVGTVTVNAVSAGNSGNGGESGGGGVGLIFLALLSCGALATGVTKAARNQSFHDTGGWTGRSVG